MTNNEIGRAIHEAWERYSYNLLMNSDGKDYKFSDITKAFHEGAEVALRNLGIVDDNGEYISNNELNYDRDS